MDLWILLKDIVILLSASLLVGGIFSRLGQTPIVGYLVAGMILGGPGSLQVINSKVEIEAISELGVALLLFSLGLEFSFNRLKNLGVKPLLGGVVQVTATILLAFLAAKLFGMSTKESIAFGAMVSLSSTAVVLRILSERGELEMPHGRNSLGVLLTQDMAVVPLALLITVLGGSGDSSNIAWNIGKLLLMAGGLILALFVLTRIAVLALGTLTLHRNRELTVIFAIVTGLGSAYASHSAGISPALGAFVAGMLLGSSPFATQIRSDVSPLQVVLLTLFFSAAGMVADPIWIFKNAHIVALVVGGILICKLLIIWIIFWFLDQQSRVASATALCLAQVGEFAFVLGSMGRSNGVVTNDVYALVVSATIVSFILSAFLVPAAPRFGNWIAHLFNPKLLAKEKTDDPTKEVDLIIIGFGPSAQIATIPIIDKGLNVVVLDLNHSNIKKAKSIGFKGIIGDATQRDILEHAGINTCKSVIITVPHFQSSLLILKHIREQAPHVHMIVRSRYEQHKEEFMTAGAHIVTGDEHQVGKELGMHITQWINSLSPKIITPLK